MRIHEVTTLMIDRICRAYNLPLHETPVGFNHIADPMMKEDGLIGGEESGGISIRGHIPQEFQLASNGDGKLQWIVGAFYLDEEAKTVTGIPFVLPFFGPAPYILWDGKSETQAYGLYAQGTYAFNDKLKLTLGARYNKDEKQGDLVYNLFGFVGGPDFCLGAPPGTEWSDVLDDDWDATTPKIALDYQFTDDVGLRLRDARLQERRLQPAGRPAALRPREAVRPTRRA